MRKNMYRNEEGFTLIEALLALFVTSIIFLLMASGIFQGRQLQPLVEDHSQLEWHLFLNQFEAYLKDSEFVRLTRRKLQTKEKTSTSKRPVAISYQQNNQAFIRTKASGAGYQPLLLNVKHINFSRQQDQIEITVEFLDHSKRTGKLFIKEWEAADDKR